MTNTRVRAEAKLICALSASSDKGQNVTAHWIGAGKAARELAKAAYDAAVWATRWASPRHSWCELNAEAEAMLQRGWPVHDGVPKHHG